MPTKLINLIEMNRKSKLGLKEKKRLNISKSFQNFQKNWLFNERMGKR
jgi:hypothetical protein